jgi:hypothetical protein
MVGVKKGRNERERRCYPWQRGGAESMILQFLGQLGDLVSARGALKMLLKMQPLSFLFL